MTATLSIIVTAPNGCGHASLPLRVLREQLTEADELLIVEPEGCSAESTLREQHIACRHTDDFQTVLEGCRRASGDIVVVLEDHVVIGAGFLRAVAAHLAQPGVQATSFLMQNGTADNIGSRVLFAYVAGFATVGVAGGLPEPVCSSFATTRAVIDGWRDAVDAGDAQPGVLQLRLIPALVREASVPVDSTLAVTHYQRDSLPEALSAIHWNARRAGRLEASSCSGVRALHLSTRRYVGRSLRLVWWQPREPELVLPILAAGLAGWTGWWLGRFRGSAAAGDRLAAMHPPVN